MDVTQQYLKLQKQACCFVYRIIIHVFFEWNHRSYISICAFPTITSKCLSNDGVILLVLSLFYIHTYFKSNNFEFMQRLLISPDICRSGFLQKPQ